MAVINGTNLDDILFGTSLDDQIDGLVGNDILLAGGGNDQVQGGRGNDVITGDGGDDTIDGGDGDDVLDGGAGNDGVRGRDGNDILRAAEGRDFLFGDRGDDRFFISGNGIASAAGQHVSISDSSGVDTIDLSLAQSSVSLNMNNGVLADFLNRVDGQQFVFGGGDAVDGGTYTTIIENAILTSFHDTAVGNGANNDIDGGAGNDTLSGGGGNDVLRGGAGGDILHGDVALDPETYAYEAGPGTGPHVTVDNLSVASAFASAGTGLRMTIAFDMHVPDSVFDPLDPLFLHAGTASYTLSFLVNGSQAQFVLNDLVRSSFTQDFLDLTPGAGTPETRSITLEVDLIGLNPATADDIEVRIDGVSFDPTEEATSTGTVYARALSELVVYDFGNDTLDGGSGPGTNFLYGGLGNDTYIVNDAVLDKVVEQDGEGIDTVKSSVSYVLGYAIENLTLTGTAADATGNLLANTLTGNAEANRLDGRAGADTMIGGAGNDTYVVDMTTDVVIETAGQGTDTVEASFSYVLGANVENLTLTGTGNVNGTGNTLNNVIRGNAGNNYLNGGIGADTMSGGDGNDIYSVDNTGDTVSEMFFSGTDTVISSITYTLGANVENLTLSSVLAINGTGNSAANVITGNLAANVLTGLAGDDTLNGGAGADTMIGGIGNDIYYVDNPGDIVTELSGQGTDLVYSTATYTLSANVENLVLTGVLSINGVGNSLGNVITGNALANVLSGGAGNDELNGGAGADTMDGGLGNDLFFVDNAGDVVIELAGQGTDTVKSQVTYALSANVENLELTGTGVIQGTGNDLDNVITGNGNNNVLYGEDGNDYLNGGRGADLMFGGLGNDVFAVDHTGDVVLDAGGVDRVEARLSYVLGTDIENLTLLGTANVNGTGNALTNRIQGNSGNNIINGLGGADTMIGGDGNDVYYVDNSLDFVFEGTSTGVDLVRSTATYSLGLNVENLILEGTANIAGYGNAGNNTITGNAGDNFIDGRAGADVMSGGGGNDTYVVDNVGDAVLESSAYGIDLVQSAVDFTLPSFVEHLTLTGTAVRGMGNTFVNTIIGNASDNILNGGGGSDLLQGGGGNDTYIVDNVGVSIVDTSGTADHVRTSVSRTLEPGIENLTLTGVGAIYGTGNIDANVIIGNSGDNKLNGLSGADILTGGLGADRFTFTTDIATTDTISDFQTGVDKIGVSAAAFGGLAAGAAINLVSGVVPAPVGIAPQFLYNTTTGILQFDRDGSAGAFAPVSFVQLNGTPSILASDFVVI